MITKWLNCEQTQLGYIAQTVGRYCDESALQRSVARNMIDWLNYRETIGFNSIIFI